MTKGIHCIIFCICACCSSAGGVIVALEEKNQVAVMRSGSRFSHSTASGTIATACTPGHMCHSRSAWERSATHRNGAWRSS